MSDLNLDQFEMRRMESLSNTIFGVAMTLLAYDMPKMSRFSSAPGWSDLYHLYSDRLAGMMLSFVIAGVFWISHQRRLTRQPIANRGVVVLNLAFLLTIILLPVTNSLLGNYQASPAVAVLYGLHLSLIAALNALLWWIATRGSGTLEVAGASFPLLALLPGTALATVEPNYAKYVWFFGFGGLLIRRLFRPKSGF